MSTNKSNEILLLKKSKRGILRIIFGRTGIVVILLLTQILVLMRIFKFLKGLIPFTVGTLLAFTIIMVLYVINSEHNTNVKLSWITMIMLFPGFGGMLYIFIQTDIGHRTIKKRIKKIVEETQKEFMDQEDLMKRLEKENKGLYNLATYTGKSGGYPIYENTSTKYFPLGEDAFKEMLIQLKKAEKFIFMEYFIVDEGYMWGQILKILSDKVKNGVEVRFMYDGTNEFALLPHNYPDKLRKLGIQCKVFSPIRPFLSTHYNYRDHRKILVIDGQVAFTGGINLADEYINEIEVYGHWKDTVVMIQGQAVESFTIMFLQLWNASEENRTYMMDLYKSKALDKKEKGYVIPYGDSPLDNDKVGQMIYMDILNRAEDYVYIMTPYLILDGEMVTSLQFAARRGIDVKIIMPHIPDKKFVFAQSRSHYKELIDSGVEIYEYTPGFMHAKQFLSDDRKAVVGTVNLDYRSLYHHFECGLYMEETGAIADIKLDFRKTLDQSQKVTLNDIKKYNIFMTLTGRIMRLFAPLL
ncbi:cardiolipin synthase [Tissierella creatinophila]|uniref:Cardiolipin synthase n=1 Tax=Tissierella creatinophila DSM 6911 TaxID=1123403 RepID=A0A1U7M5U5_TISCR|nr:cardiolipin synthase [Tissierella creatinophila]OLS02692.1 putative cardiolipin synthase YwiE [Tissierella creatinophila DSM 6911]